jgi:hypothetical protein
MGIREGTSDQEEKRLMVNGKQGAKGRGQKTEFINH